MLQVKSLKDGWEFHAAGLPPIHLHAGAPLVALLLTYPLWRDCELQGLIAATVISLGTILSVFAHELGHTIVAQRIGLRPLLIRLHAAGGDVTWQAGNWTRADEQRILLAGPLVNLLIGFLCLAVYTWLMPLPPYLVDPTTGRLIPVLFIPESMWDAILLRTFEWLGWINLGLGTVNLLPAYPLDGGRLLHSWIEQRSGQDRALFWVGLSGTILGVASKLILVIGLLAGFLIWLPLYIAPNWAALKAARN